MSPGAIAIFGVSLFVIAALVIWHQRSRQHDASAVYAAGIQRHFADQLSSSDAASLERILGRINTAARG